MKWTPNPTGQAIAPSSQQDFFSGAATKVALGINGAFAQKYDAGKS
jgi:hypothetical protein